MTDETESNFQRFTSSWSAELQLAKTQLEASAAVYLESYRQLASFNAWRSCVLEQTISSDSLAFFVEGQNDLLSSHVLARMGAWRAALKFLRSAVENSINGLYYKDHPVELRSWQVGNHRLGFSEGITYLTHHPDLRAHSKQLTGLEILENEYATLSKAVHGSAIRFRMTTPTEMTQLWLADGVRLNQWKDREKKVLLGLNMLFVALFRGMLGGAAQSALRHSVAVVIARPELREKIRENFEVVIG